MKPLRVISIVHIGLAALLLLSLAPFASAAHPAAVAGRGGAVACAAPEARDAGLAMLRAGGNAVDAAVATALALAVVHPQAGNLGGGGFAVLRVDGDLASLDFRETAPAAAHAHMFLDPAGEVVPERSLIGPLAAGVPGSPHGLYELHRRSGRLAWARVVTPAVHLAERGFTVSERLAATIVANQELLARFPETARVWLPQGRAPQVGQRIRLPELAATLQRYAKHGPKAIMEGAGAAAVEAASAAYGGLLTAAELAAYRPVWRDPLRFEAFGWQLAAMALPSSGGIIVAQSCGLLERNQWPTAPRFGADRAHLLVESWRRAYADRFLLGDPQSTRATAKQLLAPRWLDLRARQIARRVATPSDMVRPYSAAALAEAGETTHVSVVDGAGNLVALTTTLNGNFGSGLTVQGLGFLLNNEMDDFAAAPGRPNMFGLIQGEANAVAAGRRMLSSMTPMLAWRGDEGLALGSPGGSRIPTVAMQVFLNLAVDGDPLQAAVNRPRLHHQWLPDAVYAEEDALAPETRRDLERRGHQIREASTLGKVNAVRYRGGGLVEAAADPRGPGAAGVVRLP